MSGGGTVTLRLVVANLLLSTPTQAGFGNVRSWPTASTSAAQRCGRHRGRSGHGADIANRSLQTQSGHPSTSLRRYPRRASSCSASIISRAPLPARVPWSSCRKFSEDATDRKIFSDKLFFLPDVLTLRHLRNNEKLSRDSSKNFMVTLADAHKMIGVWRPGLLPMPSDQWGQI
jgi:hypothetical protein